MHLLNGELVEEKDLLIPARDLGLLRGYAIFDFFVTYRNHPFMIDEHINRLFNSASKIDLEIPYSKEQIKKWILKAIDANSSDFEKMIKIIVTGGVSQSGIFPESTPNIIILVDKRAKVAENIFTNGAKIITFKFDKYLPQAKTTNYIEAVKQMKKAKESDAIEVLYYTASHISECTRSNIFAVINNQIVTPKSDVLEGITRKVLLKILSLDNPIVEKDFSLEELLNAKEVFITNSNGEVIPVTKIDDIQIGDGEVGKITKEVREQFDKYTSSDLWI